MNINFEKAKDLLLRNSIWVALSVLSLLFLAPAKAELRTFFLVVAIECLALVLSAVAVKVYTAVDFTKQADSSLGQIFTGVHICVGLTVLGVYIAQFAP